MSGSWQTSASTSLKRPLRRRRLQRRLSPRPPRLQRPQRKLPPKSLPPLKRLQRSPPPKRPRPNPSGGQSLPRNRRQKDQQNPPPRTVLFDGRDLTGAARTCPCSRGSGRRQRGVWSLMEFRSARLGLIAFCPPSSSISSQSDAGSFISTVLRR